MSGEQLRPDRKQIVAMASLFRHAKNGVFVSMRSFEEGTSEVFSRQGVPINGTGLGPVIETAVRIAERAANARAPVVFCPPIAGFANPRDATEACLEEGYALSVECDVRPHAARRKLEQLLGPATLVVASGGAWTDPETGAVEDKLHLHWRLTEPAAGEDLKRLKELRILAARIAGADPTGASVVHPIRWAGTWHRKGEPRLARIVAQDDGHELELGEALAILRGVAPPETRRAARGEPMRGPLEGGEGDGRDDAELMRGIVSGEKFHPNLVPLAARFIGRGFRPPPPSRSSAR